MPNIDWIDEFSKKFCSHTLISSLRDKKFHGKLVINFADGSPHTCHLDMCVKAYSQGLERLSSGLTRTTTKNNKV